MNISKVPLKKVADKYLFVETLFAAALQHCCWVWVDSSETGEEAVVTFASNGRIDTAHKAIATLDGKFAHTRYVAKVKEPADDGEGDPLGFLIFPRLPTEP